MLAWSVSMRAAPGTALRRGLVDAAAAAAAWSARCGAGVDGHASRRSLASSDGGGTGERDPTRPTLAGRSRMSFLFDESYYKIGKNGVSPAQNMCAYLGGSAIQTSETTR